MVFRDKYLKILIIRILLSSYMATNVDGRSQTPHRMAGIFIGMHVFDAIFQALQATGVRYVVVGGVAVNLHGYQRFTKDVDLIVELVSKEALRALEALQSIGYSPRIPVKVSDFANPAIRDSWIRDKGMVVFQMYNDTNHQSVDIFTSYPLDFESLWQDAVAVDLPGASPRIASIDHLILMKQQAGRPQDVADIDMLEKIKKIIAERDPK
jgi:predicted nucleotidyltransferase